MKAAAVSAKLMGQVFDHELPMQEAWVLIAMADHAEHDGSNVFPSVARLAYKTGLSARTVQRVLKKLQFRGVLELVAEARDHRPREYRINICAAMIKAPPVFPKRRGMTIEEERGDNLTPRQSDAPSNPAVSEPTGVTDRANRGDTALSPESKATVSKRTVTRETAWPSDFVLTDEGRRYATQYGCRDPAAQWEDFRLWVAEHNAKAVVWPAKWQRWCRKHLDCSCGKAPPVETYVPALQRIREAKAARLAAGGS